MKVDQAAVLAEWALVKNLNALKKIIKNGEDGLSMLDY